MSPDRARRPTAATRAAALASLADRLQAGVFAGTLHRDGRTTTAAANPLLRRFLGYPASRPMPTVRAVYDFAARHPEVLRYMPCFCGCDRSAGHRGNHDCFVKSRDAQGRVLEWDSHGLGCAICLDVGKDAMLMFNSGASVASIRAAIDKKYAGTGPPTATVPDPPKVARALPPAAAPAAKSTTKK